MMTRQRFIEALAPYGAVYDVSGAAGADAAARETVLREIQAWFGANRIGARSQFASGCVQIYSAPHDNYPDLDFQWCEEGLLVCDLGPAGQRAAVLLEELAAARGWELKLCGVPKHEA